MLINILVRTHRREKYFDACMKSIAGQTHKEVNVIVGIEEENSYVDKYFREIPKMTVVRYDRVIRSINQPQTVENCTWFPYNHYLDILAKHVKHGWVMYLDDDDMLLQPDALESISKRLKNTDDIFFWRVRQGDKLVPSAYYWYMMVAKHPPQQCEVSGIGFCFHSKFLNQIEWGYYKMADYRVAHSLYKLGISKFIDKTLTGLQDRLHNGIIDEVS